MTLMLPSSRAEFAGFQSYFELSIAPYLAEMESARAAAVTNIFILGGAAAVIALALLLFGPFGAANMHAAIFALMLGAAACAWILNKERANITHGLLQRIAAKLGFAYRGEPGRSRYHDRLRALKILPSHNREHWEDEVSGAYAGAQFVLCEAHLQYRSSGKSRSKRTVFYGQIFALEYKKRFLGTTVVLRESGLFNALMKPGREFARVGLASPKFESAFEAWSTDQVEARDILDPIVLERFLELERLFGGKKLRAAFDDGVVLIALETGDRLNMGTMFRSLRGAERVERILKEFDIVFDLIDVLIKRADGRIGGAFALIDVKSA